MRNTTQPPPPNWMEALAGENFRVLDDNSQLFWIEAEPGVNPEVNRLLGRAIEEDVLVGPGIEIDNRVAFHLPEGVLPVEFLADGLVDELEGDIDFIVAAVARILDFADFADVGTLRRRLMPYMLHRNFTGLSERSAVSLAPSFIDAAMSLRATGQSVGSIALKTDQPEG